VLSILLDIWHPLRGKKGSETTAKMGPLGRFFSAIWLQPLLDKVPGLVSKRPYPLSVFFLLVFLLFAYGAQQIKIDTNLVEVADEESWLRIAYDIVDEKMSGGKTRLRVALKPAFVPESTLSRISLPIGSPSFWSDQKNDSLDPGWGNEP
jgi:hypothetical protein